LAVPRRGSAASTSWGAEDGHVHIVALGEGEELLAGVPTLYPRADICRNQ
jgi:hypothetical protein